MDKVLPELAFTNTLVLLNRVLELDGLPSVTTKSTARKISGSAKRVKRRRRALSALMLACCGHYSTA